MLPLLIMCILGPTYINCISEITLVHRLPYQKANSIIFNVLFIIFSPVNGIGDFKKLSMKRIFLILGADLRYTEVVLFIVNNAPGINVTLAIQNVLPSTTKPNDTLSPFLRFG